MISEIQERKLQDLFNALSPQVKGHCIRTGMIMQIFVSRILEKVPEIITEDGATANNLRDSFYARSFGVYHHLGDVTILDKSTGRYIPARNIIPEIFKRSWNANGGYVTGLMDTICTRSERWDGKGYPAHLAGNEIPIWGRICAIAEYYDELCTAQSSSRRNDVLQHMTALAGTRFDPELLKIFLQCAKELRVLKK